MNTISKLLKERRWAFLLIFFILLFNPLFYFWADEIHLKDKCFAWITCIVAGLALSTIDLFLKKGSEKIYLGILFLLSLPGNIIVWTYLYLSNLYMKRDIFWVIFDTDPTESQEYLSHFITWPIVLGAVLYVVLGVFFFLKTRAKHTLSVRKNRVLFFAPILVVLATISFQYLSQALPIFEFYKSYYLYERENQLFQREKELRSHLTMDVQCTLPDSTHHVFIVLLGESTTSCHMSLYGYHRETTPRMDARGEELDVYTDIVTPDTHTFGVMQKVLTFASHEHPEYYKEKASVVEIFNAAGFETYWISNKSFITKWGGSYGVIADQAKHIYDLSVAKGPDELVIPPLKEVLNDGVKANKIIFIHVMGNHHAYISRYPKSFNHFNHKRDNDLPDLGFRNDKMKQKIDEFDNSILYGDFVYDSILEELKQLNNISSYLLFFSDHGEEVYDTRDANGHFMSNVYPCQSQIPFVLWRSDKYKEENPNIIIDTTRPYSIEDVIYSISTLSGLEYEDNNQTLSIFSSEYVVPTKRMVGKEDYEDILKKVRN